MKTYRKIVLGVIVIYALAFGIITSLRHYNFQTQTSDMAIFVNTMWNTIHGQWMLNTLEEVPNTLGVHMSPILFLLVPFYWLFTSPYTLLIIQTIAVALGAYPLFLLARKVLENDKIAAAIAISYLLYPGLEWANFYDFHPIAFFPTLFLTAFYFAYEKRLFSATIFFVIAASTREDAILVVLFTGIYLFIHNRALPAIDLRKQGVFHGNLTLLSLRRHCEAWRGNLTLLSLRRHCEAWRGNLTLLSLRRHCEAWRGNLTLLSKNKKVFGLLIAFFAFIYFLISIKILMPHFGGGLLRLDRYAHLGGSVTEIIKNIFIHPSLFIKTLFVGDKFIYLFWLLAPLGFLPLLAPVEWLLIIPGLAENLLTNYKFQFSGLYQYDTILVGSIFIAASFGLKNLLARYPNMVKYAVKIVLVGALLGFFFRSPLKPFGFPVELFGSKPHWENFRKIIKMVPPTASVAAHTNLVPHLAHREKIYLLGREPAPVDIVIIDGADYFGFKNPAELEAYVDDYMSSKDYTLEVIDDRYFILKKK